MLKSTLPLFEFETKQKGAIYRLRLVRIANVFWLQRVDFEDWLAYVEDGLLEMQAAFASGDEAQLKALALQNVQKHNLARAIVWDDAERIFLVWHSRNHQWFDSRKKVWRNFSSQTPWHKAPFWTTSGEQFRQQFDMEWQDPECNARNALEYLLVGPQKQRNRDIVWHRGGYEEVEQVVSAAMKLEFSKAATLFQNPDSYEMRLIWELEPYGSLMPERLERLLDIIDERNVINERASVQKGGSSTMRVEISFPSMHEKVEARHFLLDWLQKHAPQLVGDWT